MADMISIEAEAPPAEGGSGEEPVAVEPDEPDEDFPILEVVESGDQPSTPAAVRDGEDAIIAEAEAEAEIVFESVEEEDLSEVEEMVMRGAEGGGGGVTQVPP